jgi:hypothetical protein
VLVLTDPHSPAVGLAREILGYVGVERADQLIGAAPLA